MPAGWLENYFNTIQTPNTFKYRYVISFSLRTFGRKIRIFCLSRKNSIVIKKSVVVCWVNFELLCFQLAKVIKQLRASHRLILSGTPIQVRFKEWEQSSPNNNNNNSDSNNNNDNDNDNDNNNNIYYMTWVCSRSNACSDWLILGHFPL